MATPNHHLRTDDSRPGMGRIGLFVTIALTIWTAMHVYVGARLLALPALAGAVWPLGALALLWFGFPASKVASRLAGWRLPEWLVLVTSAWLGVLFQFLVWFVVADVAIAALGLAPGATHGAFAAFALLLSGFGIFQGMRPPRVVEHELFLARLPADLDGTTVVHLTDLHLGRLLDERWLRKVRRQVDALVPDLIALTGDIVDTHPSALRPLLPELQRLRAPLGVWAVSGNHEFYMGLESSLGLLADAGMRVLRDEWATAAPGLVVAGVDDLTARRQLGVDGDAAVVRTLGGRPAAAATIYLCHSPLQVETAAAAGVDLMLSGHTHGGQIWPFGGLVRLVYRHVAGRYRLGDMTLIVSRGTGTWGPRMRLFQRAEIHRIRLRAAA